jgi:ParB family transcriptional regulator, chromosome partitioning protein
MKEPEPMAKRKSLGRGLDALLSTSANSSGAPIRPIADGGMRELPVDLLERGRFQPRVDMREETLSELADSIRAQGVVQPIVVRPLAARGETRYEIIAGERRWRAAQLAGLETVPAVIRNIPDEAAVSVSLIENIQRENLNPVEEARSLKRLVDEFGMTHGQAAEAVGRSRTSVTNLLRLLELSEPVRQMLERRELEMGHARALLGLASPEKQLELARRAAHEGWSVRETERAVRRAQGTAGRTPAVKTRAPDPNVTRLETELSETLGAPVSIEPRGAGGKITVRYHSLDELEGIVRHIR